MEIAKGLDTYEKQIVAGRRAGLLGAIQIGAALDKIRDGNLWVTTGAKSFEKYVQSTFGFSRSSAYNMMSIAIKFGQYILADQSLQSIEPTRLIRLLPFVDESNQLDLLHQASQIPDAQGFDNQLRNMKGKVATDDPHEHDWLPWLERCEVCHKTRKFKP